MSKPSSFCFGIMYTLMKGVLHDPETRKPNKIKLLRLQRNVDFVGFNMIL